MSNKGTRSILFEEQTTTTSPSSSERAWLTLALMLIFLTVGLYWYGERQGDQPGRSETVVVDYRTTVKRPTAAEIDAQILTGLEKLTTPRPQTLTPVSRPDPGPNEWISRNEQLIRRYYEVVVNRRQLTLMDDLFAADFVYLPTKSAKLSLTDLKHQLRHENHTYAGLSYSIEPVTAYGDWIIISWSATGTTSTGEPQRWSGHTAWQIIEGRIAKMIPYTTASQTELAKLDRE
jgi:hypothetical protein